MRQEIEQRVIELDLQNKIILTGKRRDIQELLSAFDLFLMPSLFEGTPVSALEARTSGLPCLMSDTVTRSIKMSGVEYFPLSNSAASWAEAALNLVKQWNVHNRLDYSDVIKHGFDIKTEAIKLQKYYLGLG